MSTSPTAQPGGSRAIKMVVGALALVVLLAAVGLWLFFGDDAPDDVSLDGAIEGLGQATDADEAELDTEPEAGASDGAAIAGTWTVDTETGDFDYESATGSFVGFRIEEELNGVGSTTAVGRTGDVAGTMVIEGSTVVEASFDIDMTTITTNSSMRDDNVQEALETGEFPSASSSWPSPSSSVTAPQRARLSRRWQWGT